MLGFGVRHLGHGTQAAGGHSLLLVVRERGGGDGFDLPDIVSEILKVDADIAFEHRIVDREGNIDLRRFVGLLDHMVEVEFFGHAFDGAVGHAQISDELALELIHGLVPEILGRFYFREASCPDWYSGQQTVDGGELERGTAFALHRNDGHRNAFDVVIARHVVAEFQAFVETFVLGDSTIQNDVILGIAHHEVA